MPVASICSLIIGKGVSITHDVFVVCSKYGCIINFVGMNGLKYYASCLCPTNTNYNLIKQIKCYSDMKIRNSIAIKLMRYRFNDLDLKNKTIFQIMGMEGIRIKKEYKRLQ